MGVTVWRGAASTVRLRADTDSKLASDQVEGPWSTEGIFTTNTRCYEPDNEREPMSVATARKQHRV